MARGRVQDSGLGKKSAEGREESEQGDGQVIQEVSTTCERVKDEFFGPQRSTKHNQSAITLCFMCLLVA